MIFYNEKVNNHWLATDRIERLINPGIIINTALEKNLQLRRAFIN